ncbi:DNA topology modulation protein [Saccharibacillus alkalitolerans]|uniref:DNA topology modulation protein n=1 Tax=Saccharibacillus alkalitolerans TaxID=2705290 RepID=A0ABX0FBD0_9BACL|nr:DNA topology modulation protein [Saccharibacillus alkalitolerans]NGZ77680.1 DNA topology modulation protein [Saccharibacillus alkalitolerans]
MQKVAVIGSPGSGKSVLSRKLGESLGLPVIHLDSHYWQAGWTPTPSEQWDEFLKETVNGEAWIVDGNYTRTLDVRMRAADTIVFLDMPRLLCMYRIVKRRLMYRGRSRPDLNAECEEKLDAAFALWVWNYRKKVRPKVLEAIDLHGEGKRTVVLTSRKEVRDFLKEGE